MNETLELKATYDLSDKTARFLVRGYYSGDGQHWIRVYDRETRDFLPGYHHTSISAMNEAQDRVNALLKEQAPSGWNHYNAGSLVRVVMRSAGWEPSPLFGTNGHTGFKFTVSGRTFTVRVTEELQ